MTSSSSSVRPWAQATRAASSDPRHRAPEAAYGAPVEAVAFSPSGRHAGPEWDRELYDPGFDADPFDWLGFAPERA